MMKKYTEIEVYGHNKLEFNFDWIYINGESERNKNSLQIYPNVFTFYINKFIGIREDGKKYYFKAKIVIYN